MPSCSLWGRSAGRWWCRCGRWRRAVRRIDLRHSQGDLDLTYGQIAQQEVEALGGSGQTLAKVRLYLSMPDSLCSHKDIALDLLGWCDESAVPVLIKHVPSRDADERCSALLALGEIGGGAREAYPLIEGALRDWRAPLELIQVLS